MEAEKANILSTFSRVLQREAHVLQDNPNLLWQQLYNRIQWEEEPIPGLIGVEAERRDAPWIRRETRFIESQNLLRTLDGDCGPIDFCTFSPDGEKIISADSYGKFIIWDSMDGGVIQEIRKSLNDIGPTALSRDGKSIFTIESQYIDSTDDDGFELGKDYVIIWDLQSGNEQQRIEGHPKSINSIRLNNDGDLLATASDDRTIKVWDVETGSVLTTLKGILGGIDDVAITPDNQFVIGFDSYIEANLQVWNLQSGKLLHTIDGVTRSNFSMISITPDGQYLITTGWDETKIWDYQERALLHDLELAGVNDLAVTPDSRYLIAGLDDTSIRVFALESVEEVLRLEGHTTEVQSVSVSPDGKRIVSGAFDGTLKVWELETEGEQQLSEMHSGRVNSVAISSDGAYGISGSADNSIKVWELQTKRLKHKLEGHTGEVSSLVVMPDGRRIVSASHDKTLKVWDLEHGYEFNTLKAHLEPILAVEVIPGGTHVISSSEDKRIIVWNIETAEADYILEGHISHPYSVKVTGDGAFAVSLGRFAMIIWDLIGGELLHTNQYITSDSIAITPDGMKVVTWRDVYNLQSGERLFKFKVRGGYDEAEYLIKDINITPDGKYAVFMNSGSLEELMVCKLDDKVKKKKKRKVFHNLVGHMDVVGAVATTPDGTYAVSGSDDRSLRIWDLAAGEEITRLPEVGRISCCAVSPDGKQIVAGDQGGQVHILKLENFSPGPAIVTAQETQAGNLVVQCKLCSNTFGADMVELGTQIMCWHCGANLQVNKFAIKSPLSRAPLLAEARQAIDARLAKESDPQWLAEQDFIVTRIALSPDGQFVGAGSYDGSVWVWNLESGALQTDLEGHEDASNLVAMTSDSNRIVSASWDASIKVWDLTSGELQQKINAHHLKVSAMVISPDDKYIFSAGEYEKTIKAWSLANGHNLYTIQDLNEPATRIFITPDSEKVLAILYDATIGVWDSESGEHLFSLGGHDSQIMDLAVTSDSRYLLSSSDELRFWDLETGKEIRTLDPKEYGSNPIIIMRGDKYALSASGIFTGKRIKIWDLESGKVLHTIKGHRKSVDHLLVTPDNRHIISSSLDHTLKMWDFETGEELRTFSGHQKLIRDVLITPDGSHVISSSEDNTIRVWNLETGEGRMLFPRSEWNA